jgi:ABC-type uncharacterized transport system substrate-binding protein
MARCDTVRRRLVKSLLLAGIAAPSLVEARQSPKVPRIGILATFEGELTRAFRSTLWDLGWIEGRNIVIDVRLGEGEQFGRLVAELVQIPVDVIVVTTTAALPAVQRATTQIPVVAPTLTDPVAGGYAKSFARPGGNITGLTFVTDQLATKRLELLKEAVPNITQMALLWHPRPETARPDVYRGAAATLGVKLEVFEARGPADFEPGFAAIARGKARGLVLGNSPLFNEHRHRIATLALKHRLPTISGEPAFAEAGGLMSHAPSLADNFRRAAHYVDKILKGANPAELPIEQPARIVLAVNLKTARHLGLTLPPPLLLRAEHVIE